MNSRIDRDSRGLLELTFGRENAETIAGFISRFREYDSLLIGREDDVVQNFLCLAPSQCEYLIDRIRGIADSSLFSVAFIVEQIPTLLAYDRLEDLVDLAAALVHVCGREVSYMFGSSGLKTPDIGEILAATSPSYFSAVLTSVQELIPQISPIAPRVIRAAPSLEQEIALETLPEALRLCCVFHSRYGIHLTGLLIAALGRLYRLHGLDKLILLATSTDCHVDSSYVEIFLHNPECLPMFPNFGEERELTQTELIGLKRHVLRSGDLSSLSKTRALIEDPYFQALASRWHQFPISFRENVLSQLDATDFRRSVYERNGQFLADMPAELRSRWDQPWFFTNEIWNERSIYARARSLMRNGTNFTVSNRLFYQRHRGLVDGVRDNPTHEGLRELLDVLHIYCCNDATRHELSVLAAIVSGRHLDFVRSYRADHLLLSVWRRDPWIDYARSDEIYACKSLGDYAEVYTPAFLEDLSLSNIDVWSSGKRIGRVHLVLTRAVCGSFALLVDSVEGSERMLQTESRCKQLTQGILLYGRYLGVDEVFFNSRVYFNHTPKAFLAHLRSSFRCRPETKLLSRLVPVEKTAKALPYPISPVLESFKNRNTGLVQGFSFPPRAIVI